MMTWAKRPTEPESVQLRIPLYVVVMVSVSLDVWHPSVVRMDRARKNLVVKGFSVRLSAGGRLNE